MSLIRAHISSYASELPTFCEPVKFPQWRKVGPQELEYEIYENAEFEKINVTARVKRALDDDLRGKDKDNRRFISTLNQT